MPNKATAERFIHALRRQAKSCDVLNSPLNARLLRACVPDFEAGGVTAQILEGWQGDPVEGLVATRFIGGVHYLVLSGQAPALAEHYPSVGGSFDPDTFDKALFETLGNHVAFMRNFVESPPQTNEVRRCGVLLGGFLTVAGETGLPLRCLEVGSSAGLNQLWDQFHYDTGTDTWGDPTSPMRIETEWRGKAPDMSQAVGVSERAGCDIRPIDLSDDAACLRMEAYVWTDHADRVDMLRTGIKMVQEKDIRVKKADAAAWTEQKLSTSVPGQTTVLYHSIAAQYFDKETTVRFETAIKDAGKRATSDAPFAWLRFEHKTTKEFPFLDLTIWPGGESRTLGQAHPHGQYIDWL